MDSVKTYDQVNQQDDSLSFGISKMEDIYSKRSGEPDTPHRHDYFTVLITLQAKGKHIIDFNEYKLGSNQVFYRRASCPHETPYTNLFFEFLFRAAV